MRKGVSSIKYQVLGGCYQTRAGSQQWDINYSVFFSLDPCVTFERLAGNTLLLHTSIEGYTLLVHTAFISRKAREGAQRNAK
jgi:hypothetical protein